MNHLSGKVVRYFETRRDCPLKITQNTIYIYHIIKLYNVWGSQGLGKTKQMIFIIKKCFEKSCLLVWIETNSILIKSQILGVKPRNYSNYGISNEYFYLIAPTLIFLSFNLLSSLAAPLQTVQTQQTVDTKYDWNALVNYKNTTWQNLIWNFF